MFLQQGCMRFHVPRTGLHALFTAVACHQTCNIPDPGFHADGGQTGRWLHIIFSSCAQTGLKTRPPCHQPAFSGPGSIRVPRSRCSRWGTTYSLYESLFFGPSPETVLFWMSWMSFSPPTQTTSRGTAKARSVWTWGPQDFDLVLLASLVNDLPHALRKTAGCSLRVRMWDSAPSQGAQSRAAAPWHRKESIEAVRASDQDTSWTPSFRGKVHGLRDVLGGIHVPTGLRVTRGPQGWAGEHCLWESLKHSCTLPLLFRR